jgi:hypothetical protein
LPAERFAALRQSEIQHFDQTAARDHHVAGLEIAMDHTLFVRGLHRLRDLAGFEGTQELITGGDL